MKLSERQQQNKKKSQEQLQAIVDAYHGKTGPVAPAPKAKTPQKKTAVKKQVVKKSKPKRRFLGIGAPKKKAPAKTKEQLAKEQARAQAREAARMRRGDTAERMRETIENYRSVPMSESKRRRRNLLFYSILIGVMLIVFGVLSLTVLFNIAEIEVEGEGYYTEQRIIDATGIQLQDNMFRTNMSKIEQRLVKELPRIKTINIRRVLMDKLVIEVVEAEPVGVVPIGGDYVVLDADSKVLEVTPVQPLDLVLLSGCAVAQYEPGRIAVFESAESVELIASVMTALDQVGLLEDTVELNVEKRYDISFCYGQYLTCELGDAEKLDSKMQMILKVMESNPADVTATIDASDANKVYYRPQYE